MATINLSHIVDFLATVVNHYLIHAKVKYENHCHELYEGTYDFEFNVRSLNYELSKFYRFQRNIIKSRISGRLITK